MRIRNSIPFFLLTIFAALAVTSLWNDSANYDERIHLPAGYSYLTRQDMRINPEHPPLVKDLSALPLLFMNINFPHSSWGWNTPLTTDPARRSPSWQTDVAFGNDLLYYSGNDAQDIMRFGRIPIILIGILLGFYLWKFCRELWGGAAAAIALAMYSFSPTILAHTRLVTTDVAAAAAFFISFYYLYKWLKTPIARNLLVFGIVLGLAFLTKFSTVLLIPIFGIIILIYPILRNQKSIFWIKKYIAGFIFALIISFLVIGAVYAFHIRNYPPSKQAVDTTFILSTFKFKPLADFNIWLSSQPYIRAYGQYFLGVLMVLERSAGGNTTYYLGNVSASGSHSYFPAVYLIKEPLPYILLTLFSLFLIFKKCFKYCGEKLKKYWFQDFIELLKNNPAESGMLFIIFVYLAFSINSKLNIGIRHILPTLPFIYALTARQIIFWIKGGAVERIKRSFVVFVLLAWAFLSVISIYPYFLAYFNEIAGGPNNGYKFVVDSNLDWGQDILRLADYIKNNNIKEIKMDYFSGAPAEYYIKTAKIDYYNREELQKGWLAISATIYSGACKGDKIPCSYGERAYTWLDSHRPVAKIGYSIFVYKIE